jgi:hypothetical protein
MAADHERCGETAVAATLREAERQIKILPDD